MMIPVINDDIREVPASVLAYVGDAVYELYFRLRVAARYAGKSGEINKRVIVYVKASSQASAARTIFEILSEEEQAIFRRGKNSNPGSMPKNASPADYRYATGLEALVGYLYLTDQNERLDTLLSGVADAIESGRTQ